MGCPWITTGGNNNSSNISLNNNVQIFRLTFELQWECKLQALGFCADLNLEMTEEDPDVPELVREFPNPVEVREVIEISGHVSCHLLPVVTVLLPLPSLVHRPLKSLPGLHLHPDLIRQAGFRIPRPVWFLLHLWAHRLQVQILSNLGLDQKQQMRTRSGTHAKCVRSGSLPHGTSGFTVNPIPENDRTFVTIVGKALCCPTYSKSIYGSAKRTIQEEPELQELAAPHHLEARSRLRPVLRACLTALPLLKGYTKPHRYLNSKAFWKVVECLTMVVVAPCITKDMKAHHPWEVWLECPHPPLWVLVKEVVAYTNNMVWGPLRICPTQEEGTVAQLPPHPPQVMVGRPTMFRLIF